MKHIKGPDFPTGAHHHRPRRASARPIATGRGRVVMRARAHIEELQGRQDRDHRHRAAVRVKKGGDDGVIKKIADLVNDKVITEISDLNDHSDRNGMRHPRSS